MNSYNINNLEYSNFSQNGEDGIIEFLTDFIINNDKHFVEIGCSNGLENNTTNLLLNGWSGLVCDIPQNILQYSRLLKIIQPQEEIKHISGKINLKNIGELISILKYKKITFFSLDIDSYDFFIMLELLKEKIFPKIICVEYNSFLGKEPFTVKYKENFKRYIFDKDRGLYFGSSLEAWQILFKKYNYKFICVDKNGVNAFFVLPKYFEKIVHEYTGLQFEYAKVFIEKYKLDGAILESDLLNNFKNELINVETLI